MLVSATMEFLRRHSPFDRMEGDALRFLAERLKLAYYHKDAAILTPDMGAARTFYIIQRGKVVARQAGEVNVTEYNAMTLGPGNVSPSAPSPPSGPPPTAIPPSRTSSATSWRPTISSS